MGEGGFGDKLSYLHLLSRLPMTKLGNEPDAKDEACN